MITAAEREEEFTLRYLKRNFLGIKTRRVLEGTEDTINTFLKDNPNIEWTGISRDSEDGTDILFNFNL